MVEHEMSIQNTEYWETLYNQKDICDALLLEGAEVAKVLFKRKVLRMSTMEKNATREDNESCYVLLTSLNRSLYTYLLLTLNISLAYCCFACRAHTHTVSGTGALLKAGYSIIDQYASNLKDDMPRYQFMKNVCSYLQEHLEDDLSIERVCEHFFVSRSYLCRSFRTLTGGTFSQYLTHQRLSRARLLLISTAQSIEEISASCGFHSQAYFSSVFRCEMGMTPSAFRRDIAKQQRMAEFVS